MSGFVPVRLDQFVAQYVRNNQDADKDAIRDAVEDALAAWRQGVRCACGRPLWVAGSAVAGYACYRCITGSDEPDGDPEILEVCDPFILQDDHPEDQALQVALIMKNYPQDYRERLEALGIVWQEEEFDQLYEEELQAERVAVPETENQRGLVHFLEAGGSVTQEVLDVYLSERHTQTPNLPLIRKYFKQANPNLKAILLKGLAANPTDLDLLDDLSYFSEFDSMLGELICLYTDACVRETDMERFSLLVQDFHLNTYDQGFDALYELTTLFQSGTKGAMIRHLSDTIDDYQNDMDIPF